MTRRQSLRPWVGGFFVAALVAALALASSPAAASPGRGDDDLSPRLKKLTSPALRSARLVKQATALDIAPSGPGSLLRDGNRLVVEVRFDRWGVAGLDDLRATGARILNVSRRYQTVTVAAKPVELSDVAAVPGVGGVTEALAPIFAAADCPGLATSEGDSRLAAIPTRADFGIDGNGVSVGILSDSFDRNGKAPTHASNDVASGDLPGPGNPCGRTTPTNVIDDPIGSGSDEGRAMAQIVHDLAPGASLVFATAFFPDSLGFAANIRALANAGTDVIVDDVIYFDEPFFQDGPVAVAVNEASARGSAYFSAAGNNNIVSGDNDVASYEAPFRDAGSCPTGVPPAEGSQCMDFDPDPDLVTGIDNAYDLVVEPKGEVELDLQWAEPWFGVQTDFDAYLLDGSENVLASTTNRNVDDTQKPFELLHWKNEGVAPELVKLAIPRFAGDGEPQLKFVQLGNGSMKVAPTLAQYEISSEGDVIGPTIFGHSAAAGAVGVGAIRYNVSSSPEAYSSRGPLTHYFGPVTSGSPALPLGSPEEISKPDVVATDCGATTFFGQLDAGARRFCGTSAAAPHAAAVAALMLEANPSLSPAQIRSTLAGTATPVGIFGPDAVGAGLVNAYAAVRSIALPPKVSITEAPPALSNNPLPKVGFAASRPVTFNCSLDGGAFQPCSSPFVPSAPLADGEHGFAVTGTDRVGRSGTSSTVSFRIDTRRPRTFFRRHPPKTVRTRHRKARAIFRLGSNESDVTFVCRIDGGLPRFCGGKVVRRFRVGRHSFRVVARDAAGNVDRTPAVFRFRVKRVG